MCCIMPFIAKEIFSLNTSTKKNHVHTQQYYLLQSLHKPNFSFVWGDMCSLDIRIHCRNNFEFFAGHVMHANPKFKIVATMNAI